MTVVFVVVVATVVFVVVVIAIGGRKCAHALSLQEKPEGSVGFDHESAEAGRLLASLRPTKSCGRPTHSKAACLTRHTSRQRKSFFPSPPCFLWETHGNPWKFDSRSEQKPLAQRGVETNGCDHELSLYFRPSLGFPSPLFPTSLAFPPSNSQHTRIHAVRLYHQFEKAELYRAHSQRPPFFGVVRATNDEPDGSRRLRNISKNLRICHHLATLAVTAASGLTSA